MVLDRSLFVWITLPGTAQPVLAGRFDHRLEAASRGTGSFVYGKSYLARNNAVAIVPSLPLHETRYITQHNGGYFGFLLDAGPDSWGQLVIDRLHGSRVADAYEYLRLSIGGMRTGALAISESQESVGTTHWLADAADLPAIQEAANDLQSGATLSPQMAHLLRPGVSMGGARPKCVLRHEGRLWVAKFHSATDASHLPEVNRIEYAMLQLASRAGIAVPAVRLIEIASEAVLLVERFDVQPLSNGQWGRLRYASARTALERVDGPLPGYGSYPALARTMDTWSENGREDKYQLFRRLIFNIAITNTDDHDLNHGFVDTPDVESNDRLRLCPAFDLVPQPQSTKRVYQAMTVGEDGALSSFRNAISSAPAFDLTPREAREVVREISALVRTHWELEAERAGIDKTRRRRIAACFERLEDDE